MRVRIVSDTVDHLRRYRSAEEVDLPDEQARRWIEAGLCVLLKTHTVPSLESTAAPVAPETTAMPKPGPKRAAVAPRRKPARKGSRS